MSIEIYIGPNGWGKTTHLKKIKQDLMQVNHVAEQDILFLPSEILLMDEMKDTKDESKTMEYILTELLSTATVNAAKLTYETEVDNVISSNIGIVNSIVDDVLSITGQNRNVTSGRGASATTTSLDFISVTPEKEHKKLVKINSKELVDGKMGSGQRMQLILSLVKNSSKNYIILDEPEKYSHPSLLHRTAKIITDLSAVNKHLFIATHSAKLLSMINIDFSHLFIINDSSHNPKLIDFNSVCTHYATHRTLLSTNPKCIKSSSYFNVSSLIENIQKLHYREFIEAIFSKTVYLVEGVCDALFVRKMLQDNNLYFEDYSIFATYGKHHMMVFAKLFESLGIEVKLYFDKDNPTSTTHIDSNRLLSSFSHHHILLNTLETDIGFLGTKNDTVEFISYLDTFTVPPSYLC